jgi:hypothetical protein
LGTLIWFARADQNPVAYDDELFELIVIRDMHAAKLVHTGKWRIETVQSTVSSSTFNIEVFTSNRFCPGRVFDVTVGDKRKR